MLKKRKRENQDEKMAIKSIYSKFGNDVSIF